MPEEKDFKPVLRGGRAGAAFTIECQETKDGEFLPLANSTGDGIIAWWTEEARDHAMISIAQQLSQTRK